MHLIISNFNLKLLPICFSILNMMAKADSTKSALMRAARAVFAEKGFAGATVKDISDRAGVNVSLVSYHFHGKENLYKECLEEHALTWLENTEKLLKPADSVEDFRVRLGLFMDFFFEDHLREPDMAIIMHRDCSAPGQNPLLQDLYEKVLVKILQNFIDFFTQSQKNGVLRADLEIEPVAQLVFGGLVHQTKVEISNRLCPIMKPSFTLSNPEHREMIVKASLKMLLEGISAHAQNPNPKQ